MSAPTRLWIGPDDRLQVGQTGFLVERSNPVQGWRRRSLDSLPPTTNRSHQPRLTGWCGSYNDTSTCGCGMARVVRLAGNGRALVEVLAGDDLRQALEQAGYPELWDGTATTDRSAT
jgi:hypothetical protein